MPAYKKKILKTILFSAELYSELLQEHLHRLFTRFSKIGVLYASFLS